ncbi:MAG: GTPase Era [Vampirovibrio sp.]|jgi:GTP-binding protein Era|nr:GTPase Era [Vampirovibrio sp.]
MFRSGFVALLGRPNVGKSTLLNRLVGQKIAITSPVAQTTRHRIKGVLTSEKGQIIFLDTPGFSKPLDKLGNYLTDESLAALSEADVFVMVVDASQPPGKGDEWVASQIRETGKFVLLVLNKIDVLKNKPVKLLEHRKLYGDLFSGYPHAKLLGVSAKTGKHMSELAETVIRKLPEGPAYYPEDAVTDQRIREITAEIIREKVLLNTREEIPHSVAVGIESFDETQPELTRIDATLYVDQKSQKGIVIGHEGSMIKTIGTQARHEIEELIEGKVHLALNVKVRENWRKDPAFLKSLGLAPPTQ